LSFHDVLTGLYNRTYFEEELVRLENGRQFDQYRHNKGGLPASL